MSKKNSTILAAFLAGFDFLLCLMIFGGVFETPEDIRHMDEAHQLKERLAARQTGNYAVTRDMVAPDYWEK